MTNFLRSVNAVYVFYLGWGEECLTRPESTSMCTIKTSANFSICRGTIKLNSYSNASVFLSLYRMRISLFRMRSLVCEVEKLKHA